MKRVSVLFLIAIFVVSISGCVGRTQHAKLLQEKKAVEKKCEELLVREKGLKDEIYARQDDIKGLRTELKKAKAQIRDLDMELAKAKGESAEFKK